LKFPAPEESTLHLAWPFGQTFALAMIVMLVIVSGLEMVFRLPAVESRLPAPSIGSNHGQLEVQVFRLHQMAASGPVDCIFVGSSMVRSGIQPAAFADGYRQQTGESLRCFTFGLSGLTASAAGMLADYLVNTYHPRLLIYGLAPRDFNEAVVAEGFSGAELSRLDWMKYQLGEFNITGWMFARLYAFQYAYFYRDGLTPGFADKLSGRRQVESRLAADGYFPSDHVLSGPMSAKEKKHIMELYQDHKPLPEEIAGLQRIIALDQSGQTRLVLVEMPFYPDIVTRLLSVDVYEDFNRQIESYAAPAGVPYWPTTLLNLIPAEGWDDLSHLNTTGAALFSRWLGDRIGAAVQTGDLALSGG
jgi:hypothetical protein